MARTPSDRRLRLVRAEIENLRCFSRAEIDFSDGPQGHGDGNGKGRAMTILLGENGAGKSTLLRAIAIGLAPQREAMALLTELPGELLRRSKRGHKAKEGAIRLELCDPALPGARFRIVTRVREDAAGQEVVHKQTEPADAGFPWHRIFVSGYGVNRGGRRRSSIDGYSVRDAVMSLFQDDAPLLDPEAMLRALRLADFEREARPAGAAAGTATATPAAEASGAGAGEHGRGGRSSVAFSHVERHLKAILGLSASHRIEVTSEHVLVHGPWGGMPFHALGDGYRGTSGWLLDVFGRTQQAGALGAGGRPEGIVLVDEIDEHLHPSWQRRLSGVLKKRFPGIQFVGTTHAPLTIVNCEPGEILRCQVQSGVATVQPLPPPAGRNADEVLRGAWFELDTSFDDITAHLLERYRKRVQDGAGERELADLREALRERVGYFVASPLDELALEIASELRAEMHRSITPPQRKLLLEDAARRLRQRLQETKA